jgi:hypothetical protein
MDMVQLAVERLQASTRVSVPVYSREAPHKIDKTGAMFLVVADAGSWGGTNWSGRQRRVLRINLWSDCTRDEFGLPVEEDAAAKAWSIWNGVDQELHDIRHGWTAVCSSMRSEEPNEYPVEGAEQSALLSGTFEVSA